MSCVQLPCLQNQSVALGLLHLEDFLECTAGPMNTTHQLSNVTVGRSNLSGRRNALHTSNVGCFNTYHLICVQLCNLGAN